MNLLSKDSYGNIYFPAGLTLSSIPTITGNQTKVLVPGPNGEIATATIDQLTQYEGGSLVSSVFGRSGVVIAQTGDYTTDLILENGNLYYTNARARAAIAVTSIGVSGPASYDPVSGILNIPNYQFVPLNRTITINGQTGDLSTNRIFYVDPGVTFFNTRTGSITLTSLDVTTALGFTPISSASFAETDPTVPAYVKGITTTDLSHWNNAYSWGDHSLPGYLTSFIESDPTVASYIKNINSGQITSWDLAASWGNHALVGYLTAAIGGTGTVNTIPKFTTTTAIGDSIIKDNGNVVTINATAGSFGALQVGSYNGCILMNSNNTSAALIFQNTSSSNKLWDFTSYNNDLVINESNIAPVMYFQAGGNVGINQTNPTFKLDVNGTSRVTGVATFGSTLSNGTYTYTLPSATGTLALTTTLSGYLPLTGGILTGSLSINSTAPSALSVTGVASISGNLILTGFYTDFRQQSYLRFANTGGATRWGYIQHDGNNLTFYNDIVGGGFTFNKTVTFSSTISDGTYTYTLPSASGTLALVGASGVGTVTSVATAGTVSGLTLTGGTITTTGTITLGGTLSLTSGNVTTALGFTPYNATNPSGYITSSGSITGTASNITAYTINQSVGTANSPTFAQARFNGRISIGDGVGTPFLNTGSPGIWCSYSGGSDIFFGAQSSTVWGVYVGAWQFTVNSSGNIAAVGTITSTADVRAPIFYDSNDTTYYLDMNSASDSAGRIRGGILFGPNTTWGAYLRVGGNGDPDTSYANVAATNGNLHLDSKAGYAMYLNHYANGIIYLNGSTYYISANGSQYNGNAASATYATSAGSLSSMNISQFTNNSGYITGVTNISGYAARIETSNNQWTWSNGAHTATNPNSITLWDQYGSSGGAGYLTAYATILDIYGRSGHEHDQLYFDSSGTIYHRNCFYGTNSWSGWRTMIDSSNIGSQSVSYASTAGSASSASTAGSVTGSSTMNGYLTVSANWSTSPYTSAFTIIGTYPSMTLRNSTADYEFLMHSDAAGDLQYYFGPGYTVNSWTQRYTFGRTGNFEVRTGTITASGDITAYSDIRVKENIEVIENALEKVQAIRGVTFNRTDLENDKGSRHAGVIAQEVLEVLPEVVKTNDKGMYSVAYGNITALLIQAIKEQQLLISSQRADIEELKRQINYIVENK